jgi:hypothetical protein
LSSTILLDLDKTQHPDSNQVFEPRSPSQIAVNALRVSFKTTFTANSRTPLATFDLRSHVAAAGLMPLSPIDFHPAIDLAAAALVSRSLAISYALQPTVSRFETRYDA